MISEDKKDLSINIIPDVLGVVVVGGYSKIAKKSIEELKKEYPDIEIRQIENKINL